MFQPFFQLTANIRALQGPYIRGFTSPSFTEYLSFVRFTFFSCYCGFDLYFTVLEFQGSIVCFGFVGEKRCVFVCFVG